jgi:integration host factor subunit beta
MRGRGRKNESSSEANGRIAGICGSIGNPMTKRGIIEELLARQREFSHRQAETIINAMFEEMASVLARGGRIEIRGFGSFGVKQRRARQGRNPRTGDMVDVEAKRVPFFRTGKDLRAGLNGAEQETRTRRSA